MAFACSDRFVRIYDRRMLQLRAPTATAASPVLLHLAPLHLCLGTGGGMATYHGEQVRRALPTVKFVPDRCMCITQSTLACQRVVHFSALCD